jgi:TldD protein
MRSMNTVLRLLATLTIATLLSSGVTPAGQDASDDPMLEALAAEIDRAMNALAESDPPPYFIAIEMIESRRVQVNAEAGGLHGYSPGHQRWIDVDLRVGSRDLDSSHALRNSNERPPRVGRNVPLGEDPNGLQSSLWLEIDRRYQQARERWAKVEAERQVLVEEEPAEDLVEVPTVKKIQGGYAELEFDAERWERTLADASRVLASHPVVLDGTAALSATVETRWFVSSEGTRLRHSSSRYRASLQVQALAEDGDNLRLYESFDAHDPSRLPSRDEMLQAAEEMVSALADIRSAPLEEPYTGPAILSDRAAGVFFHEIFGHRVEGHRLKQVDNAQTFRNRVGQQILPTFLSVYDDPTLVNAAGADLNGHYMFDNQGVPAERVVLVEQGTLRGFLQNRSPVNKGDRSNGHGRRQPGNDPVSRQGTLIVEVSESVDDDELRRQLVELAREQGLEYGLYIDEIQGGFTFTNRAIPNAFSINAVRSRRVFVDGRPDELVRGIDLIGTPLEAFSKIVTAGALHDPFNGMCGAESGWVPVSAVVPALLIQSIETQRKRKDQATPPILPPPLAEDPESRVSQVPGNTGVGS